MRLPLFQVDAFTNKVFRGNPAAVVILQNELPDSLLQAVAAENSLSETAFVLPKEGNFGLRWFTPRIEVELCGHATLATAFVLFETGRVSVDSVHFDTLSGLLTVQKRQGLLSMDFPALPPRICLCTDELVEALGRTPEEVYCSRDLVAVFGTESEVADVRPDFQKLMDLDAFALAVTAPGDSVDFVSRFFAPKAGILEDPVTGSVHCTLAPFWASRLGKRTLQAHQISSRGGEVHCEVRGHRVIISGQAVLYLTGEIHV